MTQLTTSSNSLLYLPGEKDTPFEMPARVWEGPRSCSEKHRASPKTGALNEANLVESKGTEQTAILEIWGNLTPPGLLFRRKPVLTWKPISDIT